MAKATKLEMLERERIIIELMAEGVSKTDICEKLANQYKISPRSVETQYYQIVGSMQQLVDEKKGELRANLMARQEEIFKRSMKDAKYKTALDATVAQAKLGGLYENVASEPKQPEIITIKEKDFSGSLEVVPAKAENE